MLHSGIYNLDVLLCCAVNHLGGLSGFGTWGYQGSFSFQNEYYPDPDPATTELRRQADIQAAANQRQAAANRRQLIIGLSVGLGIPVHILLGMYLLSVAIFILTWRRRASDRQTCDRVHNFILKDPSKVGCHVCLVQPTGPAIANALGLWCAAGRAGSLVQHLAVLQPHATHPNLRISQLANCAQCSGTVQERPSSILQCPAFCAPS